MLQSVKNRNRKKSYARLHRKGKGTVTADDAWRLHKVFERNEWIGRFGHENLMDRYITLFSKLEEKQKALILDLTARFLWKSDYTEDIVIQLNRILTSFKNYETYYVLRCIKQEDERKAKSSGTVLYEIKGSAVKTMLAKPVIAIDNMNEVKKQVKDFNSSLFILVDDFIGTGDTAAGCVDQLIRKYPDMKGRIVVMCVVAQRQGVERLKEIGICVFASEIRLRGINDFYRNDILARNITTMKEIEESLSVRDDYKFGYGRSEALVCLKRCPNNTFPIYWHGSNTPHPRY